jgi:hypothetical protein
LCACMGDDRAMLVPSPNCAEKAANCGKDNTAAFE